MKRSLLFRSFVLAFALIIVVTSLGFAAFDDDDDSPLDFQLDALPAFFQVFDCSFDFAGYYQGAPQPLIRASTVHFLEMHEKSPPFSIFAF